MTTHVESTRNKVFALMPRFWWTILFVSSAFVMHQTSFGEAASNLERVMVIHRHGARTALLECQNPTCKNVLVPPTLGPGTLTEEGKLMLFQLGRHINKTYGKDLLQFFNFDEDDEAGKTKKSQLMYDPRQIYSRAADEDRTVQSGISLIQGMFCESFYACDSYQHDQPPLPPSSSSSYGSPRFPVMHTMQKDYDLWLDPWGGMPIYGLRYHVGEPLKYIYMNALVQQTLSNATLAAIGEEVGFGSECPEEPYNCIGDAIDFGKYAESKGTLASEYPLLNKWLPMINWLWMKGNNYTYHGPLLHPERPAPPPLDQHRPSTTTRLFRTGSGTPTSVSEEVGFQSGLMGYPLAKELTRNARGVSSPAGSSFNSGTDMKHSYDQNPKLIHYSGHDVTLMPLTAALGNDTISINPPFGAAVIIEVWSSKKNNRSNSTSMGNSASSSQLWVKNAQYGYPADPRLSVGANRSFTDNFKYTFEPYSLWCMNSNGEVYPSSSSSSSKQQNNSDGCPLEDWERFVDHHSGPRDSISQAFGGQPSENNEEERIVEQPRMPRRNLTFTLPVESTLYCTALESDLDAIQCNPAIASERATPSPGSHCYVYRRRCPLMACSLFTTKSGGSGSDNSTDGRLLRFGALQMDLSCA